MSKGRITAAERRLRKLKALRTSRGTQEIYLDSWAATELARRLEASKRRIGVLVYPDGDPPGWDESMGFRTGIAVADRMNTWKLRDRMWRDAGVEPKRVPHLGEMGSPIASADRFS